MSLENELFSAVVGSLGQGLAVLQERCTFSFSSSEVKCMGENSPPVSGRREILAPKSQGTTTTSPAVSFPYESSWEVLFHVWSFSKRSVSKLPALCSSSVCLLSSVRVVHVAHVLSFAGLCSRITCTLRHRSGAISPPLLLPTPFLTAAKISSHCSHFS